MFKQFNVSVYGNSAVPSTTEMDDFTNKVVTTYILRDVRALARSKFGSVENMLANKALAA